MSVRTLRIAAACVPAPLSIVLLVWPDLPLWNLGRAAVAVSLAVALTGVGRLTAAQRLSRSYLTLGVTAGVLFAAVDLVVHAVPDQTTTLGYALAGATIAAALITRTCVLPLIVWRDAAYRVRHVRHQNERGG